MAVAPKTESHRCESDLREEGTPANKLILTYQLLQERYEAEGVTQHNQLFLRKLAYRYRRNLDSRKVLEVVVKVARILMMNDLEIVGWSIYLDRLSPGIDLDSDLTHTAFAAKFYFNDDIRVFQAFLERSSPNFSSCYNDWFRTHSGIMRISPKELHQRFRQLSEDDFLPEPREIPDYNFLVERILQSNPLHAAPEPICLILPPKVKPSVSSEQVSNQKSECGVAEMQMDDLKLERNVSTGSVGEFQGWTLPGFERVESIGNVWPEVVKQEKRGTELSGQTTSD